MRGIFFCKCQNKVIPNSFRHLFCFWILKQVQNDSFLQNDTAVEIIENAIIRFRIQMQKKCFSDKIEK